MMTSQESLRYFESMLPSCLSLLQQLVELESYSLDKDGVDALAVFLAEEFRSRGAAVTLLPHAERGSALKAVWKTAADKKPILVLGHLDTVWPRGAVAARPFRLEGRRAFGPGVFDMKSGILLALMVCQALRDRVSKAGSDVIFFFTADEEVGTEAGLPALRQAAEACRAVLCLEPPLPGGKVKTFRKGVGTFHIRVSGIPAHAGVDHARGANAILELSRQVVQLQAMTDYERGITVSVGRIQGGTASNVVPAEAEAEVDFRVSSAADGEGMEKRIRSLAPFDPRCTLHIDGGVNRPPLERTPAVIALYQKARVVAADLGMDLGEGSTGGGSDGSFTAAMGVPTLDGLGIDGDGAHATDEYVEIGDIPRRAALLCQLIRALTNEAFEAILE